MRRCWSLLAPLLLLCVLAAAAVLPIAALRWEDGRTLGRIVTEPVPETAPGTAELPVAERLAILGGYQSGEGRVLLARQSFQKNRGEIPTGADGVDELARAVFEELDLLRRQGVLPELGLVAPPQDYGAVLTTYLDMGRTGASVEIYDVSFQSGGYEWSVGIDADLTKIYRFSIWAKAWEKEALYAFDYGGAVQGFAAYLGVPLDGAAVWEDAYVTANAAEVYPAADGAFSLRLLTPRHTLSFGIEPGAAPGT